MCHPSNRIVSNQSDMLDFVFAKFCLFAFLVNLDTHKIGLKVTEINRKATRNIEKIRKREKEKHIFKIVQKSKNKKHPECEEERANQVSTIIPVQLPSNRLEIKKFCFGKLFYLAQVNFFQREGKEQRVNICN